MNEIVPPSEATAAAKILRQKGVDACRAALRNLIALCQTNIAGRSYTTVADLAFEEAVWNLAQKTFGSIEHEKTGDHIPHTQAQQKPPAELEALVARLADTIQSDEKA